MSFARFFAEPKITGSLSLAHEGGNSVRDSEAARASEPGAGTCVTGQNNI